MSGSQTQQTVVYDEIAYAIRRPSTQIEVRANYSNVGLLDFPAKAMLIGQMAAGNAGSPGVPYQILRSGQAAGLFGVASMLTTMCEAYLAANSFTPVWAMGALPVAGAVPATVAITLTGAAIIAAGTVPVYIAGRFYGLVVKPGDGVATQAANLAALVNADAKCPFSATSAAGVVTLTAKEAGAHGASIDVRVGLYATDMIPPGFNFAIGASAGAAGTPDITPLLGTIATTWYTHLASGFSDNNTVALLNTELDRRFLATGKLDMLAFIATSASIGTALAANTLSNSRFLCRVPLYRSPSPPWAIAASICGVAAFQLTNDPARQLRTLPLPGIVGPAPADRYLTSDQENLLNNGYGTLDVLSDGTVTIQRLVSSYQTSPLGVPDTAWLDIMRAATMTRIRYDWAGYLGLMYPRHKLADDDTPAAAFSDVVATPRRVANSWAARCKLYEQYAWIEGATNTSKQAVFVRDPSDRNRLNSRMVVNQVGNFMVFAGRLEFMV